MSGSLFTYKCRNCATVAVAAQKATYGNAYQCVLCRSYMTFLFATPIVTDADRKLAARGLVYNPGVGKDPEPGSLREIPS